MPYTEPTHEQIPEISVELFNNSPESKWEDIEAAWLAVKEDILRIEHECFGEKSFADEEFEPIFVDPQNIVVILKNGEQVIGFTIGIPDEKVSRAVYIETTNI